MRVTRCHVELALQPGHDVVLPEATANHLVRVLRLREGDAFVLFNGDGHDYPARLAAVGKREARASVLDALVVDNESPLRITLLQGIARGEKMDLILQKATELGVAAIRPVISERTEVKLDAERTLKRMQHWQTVIQSACEQSGRARIPTLHAPQPLQEALRQPLPGGLRLILDPTGSVRLNQLQAAGGEPDILLAIGPEGGWSARDLECLHQTGMQGLQLGPRILRTETAGLAAIAALQSRLGDF